MFEWLYREIAFIVSTQENQTQKNTSSIQSEDNAHKSMEEMSYQPGSTMCYSFSQLF